MKHPWAILSWCMVFSALGFCGITSPALALVITPARTEMHLLPGTSTKAVLTATNNDKVEVQVDVSKKDWFVLPSNKALTVDKWLKVHGPARFYLKPGKSRTVTLMVSCPKETDGELVGMVSFRYQTEHPSMVTPMISVSMYVIAAGHDKMEGAIKDIVVRRWQNTVVVTAAVKAGGNVHVRPSGRLIVTDSKGGELASLPVPQGQPTYPGQEQLYGGQMPANVQLPPGTYTAKADLAYQDLKFQGSRDFTILPTGELQMAPAVQLNPGTVPKL